MKYKPFCLLLLAGITLLIPPLTASSTVATAGPVEITYLANEGFLVEAAGKRVLVDALFRAGIKPYLTLPGDVRDKLEQGQKPYDRIDLVLASHFHADHFDPLVVAEHLKNNRTALFISTNQAVGKMKSEVATFAAIQDRVRGEHPKEGERVRLSHRGINLQVLNVHHGRSRPIENLGLIWEMGGRKFLHIGDSEATAADFKSYGVLQDRIDVAFIPYWYLLGEDQKKAVRESINPRHLVLMHIPERSGKDEFMERLGGWDKWFEKVRSEFPNAVLFVKQMEKKKLE